ncbi:MAG: molecular chaperone HtpG, partial [Verrucomicrobiales bacterium]|nr:molecular chaperone HtpG [Verrucomicrobiales bacterium]
LTGRFLKFLKDLTEKDPAAYEKFYQEVNRILKVGVVTDFAHKADVAKLLRYESSGMEAGKLTSLSEYVTRMQAEQTEIYYLLAPNREAAENSPYFEVFKSRKLEVLFMYDPWDEFVMEHLHTFEEKDVRPAEKAELNLADTETKEGALSEEEAKGLAAWLKERFGGSINEVRASQRLVDSPAVVVDGDKFMTSSMRRIMKSMKKEGEEPIPFKQDLEINPRHPIITRLDKMRHSDVDLAGKVAEQVLDNARVAAGLLEDPRKMLKRLNELLEQVLTIKG